MSAFEERGGEELTSLWARFSAELTYDALPEAVRATVRAVALDCIGVALAANTLGVGVPQLLAWARGAGGAPQASLIGLPDRLPAAAAAMVNGGMAHALNFDDTTAVGSGHLGPVTLPTAFAAAELRGGLSGEEFIAALAAGMELMSRIGAALAGAGGAYTEAKPQPTQMPGCFAAAKMTESSASTGDRGLRRISVGSQNVRMCGSPRTTTRATADGDGLCAA